MVGILAALLLCDILPFVAIAMLFPQLAKFAPTQSNYRGKQVLSGLGIVWFVWLAFIWVGSVFIDFLGFEQPVWMQIVDMAFPLLAGTCAFGLFDDWVGDNRSKGFKGHFRELSRGHLTTGMLKFIGIGLFSLATGFMLYDPMEPMGLARIIFATLVIALSANFFNLLDLRPLRASKAYIFSMAFCIIALLASGIVESEWHQVLCTILAVLGPVLATWKLDADEVAMLGDAGANTMGALVGFIFSITLPIWLLVVLTVVLLVANFASEKVSYTKIIESVPFLHAIDRAFRPKEFFAEDGTPIREDILPTADGSGSVVEMPLAPVDADGGSDVLGGGGNPGGSFGSNVAGSSGAGSATVVPRAGADGIAPASGTDDGTTV